MQIIVILATLIVFGMVISIHEIGHFTAAKLCGIKVNKFAIGMGPAIFKKKGKETEYSVRLLPIGGYCAMGEDDPAGDDPRAFLNKKVWQRMIVITAGAAMNILLGVVLNLWYVGAYNTFVSTEVAGFRPGAASYFSQNGLREGDVVTKINGMHIFTNDDMSYKLASSKSTKFDVEVKRDGKKVKLDGITFHAEYFYRTVFELDVAKYAPCYGYAIETDSYYELSDVPIDNINRVFYYDSEVGEYVRLVFDNESAEESTELREFSQTQDFYPLTVNRTLGNMFGHSLKRTVTIGQLVWFSLIDLVRGEYGINDMSGPVGVTSVIGEVVSPKIAFKNNFFTVVNIAILITINLGIFNLLPFPALDGGRFVFLLVEGIRGKKINPEKEGMVHLIGMGVLLLLVVVITFNDIRKLFTGG